MENFDPGARLAAGRVWQLPAAEFEGHLMDTMCAATRLNQAAGHTLRCIKNCSKSGFGLVTKEGQYVPLQ